MVKDNPVCKRNGKMSSIYMKRGQMDYQGRAANWTRAISLEQLAPKRRERLPTEPGLASIVSVKTSTWDTSASMSSFADFGGTSLTSSPVKSPFINTHTGAEETKRRPGEAGKGPGVGGSSSTWDATASMSSFADFGGGSSLSSSPVKSPHSNAQSEIDDVDATHKGTTLQVPRSPRTPTVARSMGHMISHRFSKIFKVATCDYCFKQMIYGVKCKECKFKCHRDCEPKVPPSCGLPAAFIDVFVKSLQGGGGGGGGESPMSNRNSPLNTGRLRKVTRPPQNISIQFPGPDSSSNTSSCNSSTRSSPALFATSAAATITTPLSATTQTHLFSFPDVPLSSGNEFPLDSRSMINSVSSDMTSTQASNDSDRTVSQTSGSGSTDSEKTIALRVDSQDSQISDADLEGADRSSPRQNSVSNREWEIPFDELKLGEVIGVGHFGTVYRGNWHGDVAVKVLDQKYLDNGKILEHFAQEVAIFRKTRHENLVLFMGACMKAPRLAIVTSMCKGLSLYTHLHLRRDKLNMNKTVLIAQQISQGMGYLHARGIIHKDLKSKNVFLESGKVVITDFGLFSVTKLCHGGSKGDCLSIPPGWLCYLAPELMLRLTPTQQLESDLPFSKASDIYAFGTVWYELLCGEWPYKELPPEAIIWQVGSGIRQPLPTLFSRDAKEIMMVCWSSKPEDRPDFGRLVKSLEKIPKKRLARSPSHPIHFSRSTFEF